MVSYTYLLTLLAATVAVGSPAPLPSHDSPLEARAGQVYICRAGDDNKGEFYGEIGQDKAIGFFRDAKNKTGLSGYPKKFGNEGNVMKFASGCTKDNVWELPVLANGKPYAFDKKKDGNSPGTMRVYYTKDLKFCAIGGKKNPNGTGNPHNCVLKK